MLVGDRILSINAVSLEGATIDQAYKLIQESDDTMTLNVEFDVTGNEWMNGYLDGQTIGLMDGSLNWSVKLLLS